MNQIENIFSKGGRDKKNSIAQDIRKGSYPAVLTQLRHEYTRPDRRKEHIDRINTVLEILQTCSNSKDQQGGKRKNNSKNNTKKRKPSRKNNRKRRASKNKRN